MVRFGRALWYYLPWGGGGGGEGGGGTPLQELCRYVRCWVWFSTLFWSKSGCGFGQICDDVPYYGV